jgi:uncharacterized membrane protein YcaP (DUF421 family)
MSGWGERRTLAQWTIIDFATAVAIVGRTAIAGAQPYATGAVALLSLIAVHRLASLLRFRPVAGMLFDHRVRVLVDHGQLRRRQLRMCGLTDNDLYVQLRQRGVFDPTRLRYVLYEAKGDLTVVPDPDAPEPEAPLVQAGLDNADGYQHRSNPDHDQCEATEMASGSGSDQVADPAADLGMPVGMQLGDRGIADQPGSG